VRGEIRAEI
jgi:hypothetical protein